MAPYASFKMAVAENLVYVKCPPIVLWLSVFLFYWGWQCQLVYSQPQDSPEVATFSMISGTGKGMRPPDWTSYSLHFGGQTHIIHMKVNKNLLARHMPVFTYTDQGALLEDQPLVQSDCFYHGYVEGDPESLVALSSCFGGFRGMLQIHDIAYEIKPRNHPDTFEHLVYRMDTEDTSPPLRCGLTDEEIERQLKSLESDNSTLMQSGYEGWWTHRRYLELAVVVDHNRYLHSDSNASNVYTDVCIVINEVGLFLKSLDVEVILTGIEIWTGQNPVPIQGIDDLVKQFCQWKQNNLPFRLPHDVTHLFVNQTFNSSLGIAFTGSVCKADYNCGVDSFINDNLQEFAFTVSHELGHNLGMAHDDGLCTCGHRSCIMFPNKGSSTRFSNCSYAMFWDFVLQATCLCIPPHKENIFKHARCGNSLIEEGEECDCGSIKLCEKDPCCQSNCTLTPGSDCAFGLCCIDCKIVLSGVKCRVPENECDLPEWCNGTSFYCPEDVYVQDGTPCANGYCYEKRCNSRDKQCRRIFGSGAKNADNKCYMEMNIQGDRFGHCGLGRYHYTKCQYQDTMCGRVQCDNVTKVPYLEDHSTVHWTQFNGISCWGTDYHFGMTLPDIGEVKDGTECGKEHICIEKKCVPMSSLNNTCSSVSCNMNGVCNNRHHCHCEFGWDPPNCQLPGNGGSIDSGPPLFSPITDPEKDKQNFKMPLLYIILGFSFIFLFIILLLIFMKTYVKRS
ncbi:disintegrin and metalloproteinase domain-containing protein 25-like [Erinaceus europaeus]|uniref:Disintegrin and metalloproteinase domain-containing protein 25-like n=1 Tax=Erinaceus europaeus TaxID=9365 RepID=A0A1S3APM3_ERIEU|nr:disintegrin and metalloproteinase domain-containing protein 25-like [Erinaceus europaeus]